MLIYVEVTLFDAYKEINQGIHHVDYLESLSDHRRVSEIGKGVCKNKSKIFYSCALGQ